MKRLLFLSFLLNTSCVDALKSMLEEPEEEEDEDEDDERREGQRQGDCTDGEDNDEDGDIDCDDSGCFDKPACDGDTAVSSEPSDEPSSEPSGEPSGEPSSEELSEFFGSITQQFDFETELEDQGYNDCEIYMDFGPGNGSISDAASCSGCTVFGYSEFRIETDCEWQEEGTGGIELAVNPTQELLYSYNPEDRAWYPVFDSSSCNSGYTSHFSGNAINTECFFEESGQYSTNIYMSFNW